MTSAKALLTEARLRDCLMEALLVTVLVLGLWTASTPGMGNIRWGGRARSSRVVSGVYEAQQQRRGLAPAFTKVRVWMPIS